MTRLRSALVPALLALALSLAVSTASAAAADTLPPAPAPSLTDNFSAADQYVESVPTARGPKVPGSGRGGRSGKGSSKDAGLSLSPAAKAELSQQPDQTATQLEQIATSPELGAPSRELGKHAAGSSRIPAATVSAIGEGETDALLWLVIALVAITVLAAATAAYRHHQSRNGTG